jgi:hypothetical protein
MHAQIAFEMLVTLGIAVSLAFMILHAIAPFTVISHALDISSAGTIANTANEIYHLAATEVPDGYTVAGMVIT